MFDAAADIPQGEIKAYRSFAFSSALADPIHDPFFSVENAIGWITLRGYQLYLEHDDSDIRAYRTCIMMLSDDFLGHLFFSLDNTDAWINLIAFQFPCSLSGCILCELLCAFQGPLTVLPHGLSSKQSHLVYSIILYPIFVFLESIQP
ncbi:hypothetical protein DFH08DRAFT_975830 [Mycena albidolilacea]|uniref:Uncharacterized protein n=1 Tax=Mycena albidolilacea TaxID=1033008 RepID=A0AAD6Z4W7_9AGAR|nr:hypothetical protein DFH08DRAFT_975830 [Mycena albidolilacea]